MMYQTYWLDYFVAYWDTVYASDESSLFQRTYGVLKRIEFPKDLYASSRYLKHRVYKFEITCTKVIRVSN